MDSLIVIGDIILDVKNSIKYRVIYIADGFLVFCQMETERLFLKYEISQILEERLANNTYMIMPKASMNVYEYASLSDAAKLKYDKYRPILEVIEKEYGPDYLELTGKQPKDTISKIIDLYHIPKSTLWRLIRKYLQSGFDLFSLCVYERKESDRQYTAKPGPKSNLGVPISPDICRIFDEAIEIYKTDRNRTIQYAYRIMNIRHFSVNGPNGVELLPPNERPTYKQFYLYLHKKLSKADIDAIKTSAAEQRNDKRSLIGDTASGVLGPGRLAEIDAVEIDISLVSEINTSQCIGRPTGYVLIDVYSRVIMAVSVSFDVNSNIGLTSLFLNLCEDKVEFCKKYGVNIDALQWPSFFLPAKIRCDRGSDFKSEAFDRFCNENRIHKDLVTGATGSLKGIVEHLFQEINLAQNPSIANCGLIEKRYDSNHHRESMLTLSEYMTLLISIIVAHNTKFMTDYPLSLDMRKENTMPIPVDIWKHGIKRYGSPKYIINKDQYLYSLMQEKKGSITNKGILFEGLYYFESNDPELKSKYYECQKKRISITLRYDPRSVNYVYYLKDSSLIRVSLKNVQGSIDFKDWTFYEWRQERREEKKRKQLGKTINEEIDALTTQISESVVSAAHKERYSMTTDMRKHRAEEKIYQQTKNRIEDKISDDHGSKADYKSEENDEAKETQEKIVPDYTIDEIEKNLSDYFDNGI